MEVLSMPCGNNILAGVQNGRGNALPTNPDTGTRVCVMDGTRGLGYLERLLWIERVSTSLKTYAHSLSQ